MVMIINNSEVELQLTTLFYWVSLRPLHLAFDGGPDRLRRPGPLSRASCMGLRSKTTKMLHPQRVASIPVYPGCLGSNWREMGPFWAWREVNRVPLYGQIFRGFTPVLVCF